MDIKGMLNTDEQKGNGHPRRSSGSQSRPPPLPSLNTSNSRMTPTDVFSAAQSPQQYPFPAQSPSFPQPYSSKSQGSGFSSGAPPALYHQVSSASAQVSPYGQSSNPQTPYTAQSAHPHTPYAQTPGHQQSSALYPPPRPSLSRSPSSSHGQSNHYHAGSAVSGRSQPTFQSPAAGSAYVQQSPTPYGYGQSPPVTPLAAPQGSPGSATSYSNKDSPYTHERHGSLQIPSHAHPSHASAEVRTPSSQPAASPRRNHSQSSLYDRNAPSRASREREKSISVSPKTVVAPLPQHQHRPSTVSDAASEQSKPSMTQSNQVDPKQSLKGSVHSTTAPDEKAVKKESDDSKDVPLTSQVSTEDVGQSPATTSRLSVERKSAETSVGNSDRGHQMTLQSSKTSHTGQNTSQAFTPAKGTKRTLEADFRSSPAGQRPRKRIKQKDPPIWAQKAKNATPLFKTNVPVRTNGSVEPRKTVQPEVAQIGPLGPLEPAFTNVEPYEELTRYVSNFLFSNVVDNKTFVGDNAFTQAQLEIEAKLGTIIDKDSRSRLQLWVESETVLSPQRDVAFESLMTEAQHKTLNEMLNQGVTDSMKTMSTSPDRNQLPAARSRMHYIHRYETDTFYELPHDEVVALPPAVRHMLRPGKKPRLRVTTDQKTGKILAAVVKLRIKDMHVLSPQTAFDWRISVNLEWKWSGDVEAFVREARKIASHKPEERHKDRMSYKHQYVQIDLTQVKLGGVAATEPIHELEVELDAATTIQQGQLVQNSQSNDYEELVRTFTNNVRVLARMGQ